MDGDGGAVRGPAGDPPTADEMLPNPASDRTDGIWGEPPQRLLPTKEWRPAADTVPTLVASEAVNAVFLTLAESVDVQMAQGIADRVLWTIAKVLPAHLSMHSNSFERWIFVRLDAGERP